MKKLILLCSTAFVLPTGAYAQSTGTVDFENEEIVVTGTRERDVGGVEVPDAPKAKAVLTQEFISRTGPGQNVLDAINVIPGVSFQNNDAYGNSGGTLSIRGFDSTRISYTLDGIQLNDSGNYQIYSNFSIDPELIEQVNVSLGSTDVDSPTASAVGGTINQRTRTPSANRRGRLNVSLGEFDYRRAFGMFDLGTFTSFGTRAFIAASTSKYDNPYNNYGKLDRQQYNAKVWQPVGDNGDFVSVAARYNRDRNNFFGSLPLRFDLVQANGDPREVGSGSNGRFPRNNDEREYDIEYPCNIDTPQSGAQDFTNSCGTQFDRRINPSNSMNLRGNSRFSLTDQLTLTVDPSYQYTKANGGGTVTGREGTRIIGGLEYTGFIGGQYYFGRDLNGDGDTLDTCSTSGSSCSSSNFAGVTLYAPSQTRTKRYAVIAGLRYDFNDEHSVRATYTHDRSDHRQTGQVGFVGRNGEPEEVFAIDDPISDANGNVVQKRDRQSYAILNQVAGEYRGEFGPLTVNLGARLPFFKRDLENFCFTTSANGFIDCFGQDPELDEAYAEEFPDVEGPQGRVLNYSKLLPTVGAVYDFTPDVSAFASYTKNISVPSTDNLYNAFFFPRDTDSAKPNPETTDSFDAGVRYTNRTIQAQLAGWFTKFNDRLASAYDPELERTVFRNLGRVDKWGIDGSVAYEPMRQLTLYAFGSWMRSKIKDNVQIGKFGSGANQVTDCNDIPAGAATADIIRSCAFTAGNSESGAPKYTYGASAVGRLGAFELGVTAKRTGPRFVTDTNLPTFSGDLSNGDPVEIFAAKAPAYTLVNLDARYKLTALKGLEKSYFQLNVYNLFDEFYVGGFGGGLNQASSSRFVPGSPSIPTFGNPGFVQIG
ncbi:MAG: TonB-dependent receptor, partial [Pseudomonadota bacterium]|nr:TonB-dependent receptor [Pseudomonadota bacterium]